MSLLNQRWFRIVQLSLALFKIQQNSSTVLVNPSVQSPTEANRVHNEMQSGWKAFLPSSNWTLATMSVSKRRLRLHRLWSKWPTQRHLSPWTVTISGSGLMLIALRHRWVRRYLTFNPYNAILQSIQTPQVLKEVRDTHFNDKSQLRSASLWRTLATTKTPSLAWTEWCVLNHFLQTLRFSCQVISIRVASKYLISVRAKVLKPSPSSLAMSSE